MTKLNPKGGSRMDGPLLLPDDPASPNQWLHWMLLALAGAVLFGGLAFACTQPAPAKVAPPLDCASSVFKAPGQPPSTPVVTGDCARASIGGTFVPDGLRCQEDEVIGFVGIDRLACRHVEDDVLDHLDW